MDLAGFLTLLMFQSTPTPRGVGDVKNRSSLAVFSEFQSTPTPRGVGD